ncbi:MAG: 3'-5' exonuclease [Planctomycetaceae bacterium]|nr:3'-5' exonuclease [Planctomycetaceae bacterium]
MGKAKAGEKGGVLADQEPVRYLIFDIESVADGALVAKVRYPGESLSPEQAVARYRAELLEQRGTDFIPYTFQMPVSVVVAKVSAAFELLDLIALDEPEWRPHIITEHFWRGWQRYQRPTLVSFNGRTFDMPLMELAAFRFGLSIPTWFETKARTYEQPRNRYNSRYHLDLHDLLTNYGASRFNGGLNLAANLLGKPGKIDVQGDMVQDLFDQGKLVEINNYCRCDVLDTYFVFLRSMVLLGDLDLDGEQQLVTQTKTWLEQRASQQVALSTYLENWGDWRNPW